MTDTRALVERLKAEQSQALDARDKAGRDGDSQTLDLLRRIVVGWSANQYDEFAEAMIEACAVLGLVDPRPKLSYRPAVPALTEQARGLRDAVVTLKLFVAAPTIAGYVDIPLQDRARKAGDVLLDFVHSIASEGTK